MKKVTHTLLSLKLYWNLKTNEEMCLHTLRPVFHLYVNLKREREART